MALRNLLSAGVLTLGLCAQTFGQTTNYAEPIKTTSSTGGEIQLVQFSGPTCGAAAPSCGAPAPVFSFAPTALTTPAFAPPTCGVPCDTCSASVCGGCCGGTCGLDLCNCSHLGTAWSLNDMFCCGGCEPSVKVGGWFSIGSHTESNDLFNDRPDEFNLHQGWLYAEKEATTFSPLGFRADVMYGIDGADTQAFGNTPGEWDFDNGFDHGAYAWAIPQLYAEIALNDTWSIKSGHFYTLVGYEVVNAPGNFFYSHAMTMYNTEPFTHTGVLATGELTNNFTVHAGWTLGWDTGFDQFNDGSSWLGGFSYTPNSDVTFTYISTAGNLGARGDDAYGHSIVLDMMMTSRLNWVVQSDVLRVESTGEDNVGINQYLLYNVSDCFGLGARVEWWKADNITGYAPHGAVLPADGSFSYYAATFGANFKPHANIIVRPEVRVDWSPAADYDESYFGIDAIFTF